MFKHIPNPFIRTFSDAVVVETGEYTTIHVSGQVGNDASGKVTAKSFEEEAPALLRQCGQGAGAGRRRHARMWCGSPPT